MTTTSAIVYSAAEHSLLTIVQFTLQPNVSVPSFCCSLAQSNVIGRNPAA